MENTKETQDAVEYLNIKSMLMQQEECWRNTEEIPGNVSESLQECSDVLNNCRKYILKKYIY